MSVAEITTPDLPAKAGQGPKKRSLNFDITPKKVPRKELMQFSRQLAVFMKAGIPILDAMQAINEEVGNKFLREMIDDITDRLREGSTFADAAAHHATAFPPYYLGILRSAELTGQLDVALVQLSEYIERDLDAKRKVTSALAYPAVIFGVAIVVVVVLVSFVLPKFKAFFASLHAKLPLPTRMLLGMASAVTDHIVVIGVTVIVVATTLVVGLQTDGGRHLKDRTLLRVPVIGDLLRHIVLERFCRILSAMMSAGVPLTDALSVTSAATSNTVYQKGLTTAREATLRGEGLAGPLIETGLFPAAARQMFRVGENTGTLDQQLATTAEYFARELDYKLKRFTTLFEPAVLLVAGVMVGFVAIAMVSAMYGIFGQTKAL